MCPDGRRKKFCSSVVLHIYPSVTESVNNYSIYININIYISQGTNFILKLVFTALSFTVNASVDALFGVSETELVLKLLLN